MLKDSLQDPEFAGFELAPFKPLQYPSQLRYLVILRFLVKVQHSFEAFQLILPLCCSPLNRLLLLPLGLRLCLRGVNHVSTLQVQEEPIVLAKQHLFHHVVTFDNVQQFDYVQVSFKLFDSLVQVKVCLCGFASL